MSGYFDMIFTIKIVLDLISLLGKALYEVFNQDFYNGDFFILKFNCDGTA